MRGVPKGMHLVAPAASAASPRPLERLERVERLVAAAAGGGAALLLTAWEIARPTLPAPFELAAVARGPAAATWEGRLPMALAATLGLVALYMLLARTADRRTGVYAAAVLATTPAWFVHGRLMTGAIVPMVCGAGDRRDTLGDRRARAPASDGRAGDRGRVRLGAHGALAARQRGARGGCADRRRERALAPSRSRVLAGAPAPRGPRRSAATGHVRRARDRARVRPRAVDAVRALRARAAPVERGSSRGDARSRRRHRRARAARAS